MSISRFTLKELSKREKVSDRRYAEGKHFLMATSHREDCFMCDHTEGLDPEAFIMYDGIEHRDRAGRNRKRGTGQMWYRFRCNDASCPAVLLVRWDAFARLLTQGLQDSAYEVD